MGVVKQRQGCYSQDSPNKRRTRVHRALLQIELGMYTQIEITTHCNYGCFYCAGRDMPQKHMSWELFLSILRGLPAGAGVISLQGEGEPMLHPRFWDMVDAVTAARKTPYTITNGSALIDPERVARRFPSIGISVDTLDADLANKVGRYDLAKVLKNIEGLLLAADPRRVIIHTVDFGQNLDDVTRFVRSRRLRHIIQPLQPKPDYAYRYGIKADFGQCTYNCAQLAKPKDAYFTIEGQKLPCFFIKDVSKFESKERLIEQLGRREVPACCEGCRMIYPEAGKKAS